ncbi:hypothetical protein Q3C01_10030 [Bradyrhizobium sp. UFLA05-109]
MYRRYLLFTVVLAGFVGLAGAGTWKWLNRIQIESSTYRDNNATQQTFHARDGALRLTRLFPTDATAVPIFNWDLRPSPVPVELDGKSFIVVAATNGTVASIDPITSKLLWATRLPAPRGSLVQVGATPALAGDKLVIVYSIDKKEGNEVVQSLYRAALLDLNSGKLDSDFQPIDFTAEKREVQGRGIIRFAPKWQISHSDLVHVAERPDELGIVYVGFGGSREEGPWHGWLFELDLDAWKVKSSAAIRSELITTPEADCSGAGETQTICGGGIWSAAGPQIYFDQKGYEILVQTGNGRLDLARGSYAQSLMRMRKGLAFVPACSAVACGKTNPQDPSKECLETCDNLFVPRLLPQDPPLDPEDGRCKEKSFLECLAVSDWDFGANAPIRIQLSSGTAVYVTAGKEGGVYLLDAKRMGILYDRKPAVDLCGAVSDPCQAIFEGTMATQPVLGWIDETPVVVVATFMADETHPAGLVAFKVVETDGTPRLEQFWTAPSRDSHEAVKMFRSAPTRALIADYRGEPIVWLADRNPEGLIIGVRLRDGTIVARAKTAGTPTPYVKPLLLNDVLYIATQLPAARNGAWLEAYSISPESKP